MNSYELKIKDFAGPMDKLLALIEEKKLEITVINLAEVTADFLNYLKTIEQVEPKLLADFVVVAAKLILIKSHTLLPELKLEAEEEKDIAELENRLRIYKELKGAEKHIQARWGSHPSFGRDFLMNVPQGFYLSQPIEPTRFAELLKQLCDELIAVFPKHEEGKVVMVNFQEKIKELMERVDKVISSSFNEIAHGKGKTEVIVLFLAVLHLLKDSLIKIDQSEDFGNIRIEKT